ncbi:MAG TPA: CBS domain-containing protein [Thermoanaerobaculia bacterium]|nr:CBS domain-containing protein [Thermoanaerobaculia bacterium]
MKTIDELLRTKGREIHSISPDATVYDAIAAMAEKAVGALVVMQEGTLAGIISERDYARKVILQNRSSRDTPVRDIMTSQVICASPGDTIESAMKLMTDRRIRHLPVEQAGQICGMISIGDLVKAIIDEQRFAISQLETYISS